MPFPSGGWGHRGDVKVTTSKAGVLTFKANSGATQGYCINVDANSDVVRLWRIGYGTLRDYVTTINTGTWYHLKVITSGSNIKVYFNGGGTTVIDYNDSTYTSGQFGLNVWNGEAVFQNVVKN